MATQTVYEQLDYNSKCALHNLKCSLDAIYGDNVTCGQKTSKNAVISALNEVAQISDGIATNARLLIEKLGGTAPTPKSKGKNAAPTDESFEDKIRRIVAEEVKKHLKIDGSYYDGAGSVTLLWGKKEFASDSL
jgi:hypothetical protein